MTEDEAREKARKALRYRTVEAEVESDAKVVFFDDPDAKGVAVEAWVYLMEKEPGS